MFYGFVAGDIRAVYDNWALVEKGKVLYPYCKYAKFRDKHEAREWVNRSWHEKLEVPENLYNYGEAFDDNHIDTTYIINNDCIYVNLDTTKFGDVKITNDNPNVVVNNTRGLVMLKISNIKLNPSILTHHVIAIMYILEIVGDIADLNIYLENQSLYYLFNHYKGNNRSLLRYRARVSERIGRLSYSIESFVLNLGDEIYENEETE